MPLNTLQIDRHGALRATGRSDPAEPAFGFAVALGILAIDGATAVHAFRHSPWVSCVLVPVGILVGRAALRFGLSLYAALAARVEYLRIARDEVEYQAYGIRGSTFHSMRRNALRDVHVETQDVDHRLYRRLWLRFHHDAVSRIEVRPTDDPAALLNVGRHLAARLGLPCTAVVLPQVRSVDLSRDLPGPVTVT